MKNNRVVYILISILVIWCIILSTIVFSKKDEDVNKIVNQIEVDGFSTDFTKIVEDNKSSIVTISAGGNLSSGFIYKQVDDVVYILTAYHGVADNSSCYVNFANDFSINATVVGKSVYADLAVIEVNMPYEVKPLTLSDSSLLSSGEFVISIGTPYSYEYEQSVELGMVSNSVKTIPNSIEVNNEIIDYYVDAIQLSSNLKPGYSGSPIINMNGDVVGMITMSLNDKFNFAITANEIGIIADKIINGDSIKKYQLGIKGSYICDMPMYERSSLNLPVDIIDGLYIREMKDSSIGLTAGLKVGDVILSINDTNITNFKDYLDVTYRKADSFEFIANRNGETLIYKVDIND